MAYDRMQPDARVFPRALQPPTSCEKIALGSRELSRIKAAAVHATSKSKSSWDASIDDRQSWRSWVREDIARSIGTWDSRGRSLH